MLVDANHAALEDGEEAFRSVGMDLPSHVFAEPMVDGFVARKLAADFAVIGAFIGHELAFAGDVGANHWRNVGNASAFHMEGAGRTAALDQAQNDLMPGAAPLGFTFGAAEKVSLISTISPAPPMGSTPTVRTASLIRCDMNHAVLRVTPRVRLN
jgi:hypothetical protein